MLMGIRRELGDCTKSVEILQHQKSTPSFYKLPLKELALFGKFKYSSVELGIWFFRV